MNIDKHLINNFCKIDDLLFGDCFIFNNIIYMKITSLNEHIENAVNLETGYLTSFNKETDLLPIQVKAMAIPEEEKINARI